MLGEVSKFEVAHGRPMLSSIVVHADGGLPGHGFYQLGQELGLVRAGEEEDAFAVRQMKETFAHWTRATAP